MQTTAGWYVPYSSTLLGASSRHKVVSGPITDALQLHATGDSEQLLGLFGIFRTVGADTCTMP